MTQPIALFLADILEDAGKPADIAERAAFELRRLHAELERCKQVCIATSESWRIDAEKWNIHRDALQRLTDVRQEMELNPVAWLHVPYPGNAISPMLSLSKHREPSIYAASVPLYLKEQL